MNDQLQESTSNNGKTLVDRLSLYASLLSKLVGLAFILIYLSGFIALNTYLTMHGVYYYDFLDKKYVVGSGAGLFLGRCCRRDP